MINKIKIYSRMGLEHGVLTGGYLFPEKKSDWYLISIHTRDTEEDVLCKGVFADVLPKIRCKGYVSVQFWDILETHLTDQFVNRYPEYKLFDEDDARKIIAFIDKANAATANSSLVVHCDAGISRSGAVGTFACDYLGLDYMTFKEMNRNIRPNVYVSNILYRIAGMRGSAQKENVEKYVDESVWL